MHDFSFELKYFSKVIRLKRHELNISQEQMAELVDCHVNAIGRLERSEAVPSFFMILKIAKALGISPKDLMPY